MRSASSNLKKAFLDVPAAIGAAKEENRGLAQELKKPFRSTVNYFG